MRFVRLGDVARIVCGESVNQLNAGCRDDVILLPIGNILVSTNTISGDFAVTDVPVDFGDDLMAIIIESPDIDANYIRLFLRSKTNGFESNGMVQVADSRNAVKLTADINVPLPPPDEQRRVVLLLEKADAICQKYRAILDLADRFLHSTSLDMFGDSMTNFKNWHTPSMAGQKRYSQIRNKIMIIKEKLSFELVQSSLLFNNLAASAFTPVEAA